MRTAKIRERRRFLASSIILAGIAANYHNALLSKFRVSEAVRLADQLIDTLEHGDEVKSVKER